MRWVDLNLKCMLGFHDYQPVDGLWWRNNTSEYSTMLTSIYVIRLYECSRCKKIKENIIEDYPRLSYNLSSVETYLENNSIYHISKFYAE